MQYSIKDWFSKLLLEIWAIKKLYCIILYLVGYKAKIEYICNTDTYFFKVQYYTLIYLQFRLDTIDYKILISFQCYTYSDLVEIFL